MEEIVMVKWNAIIKALLFAIILIVPVERALAQGMVNFMNATSVYGSAQPAHLVLWTANVKSYNSSLVPGGLVSSNFAGLNLTTLRAQLFYGSSTVLSPGSLTAVSDAPATFRASTSPNAGAWLGGTRTMIGFNPGDTVHLDIFVWDLSLTPDPLSGAAQGGLFGTSGIFSYTIPPAGLPSTAYLPVNQPPFLVGVGGAGGPFPEPGSFALIGLGAMTLLVFRRQGRRNGISNAA